MSGDRAVHHCLSRGDRQLLFGKVKLMLNVPIAQGDHVYILRARDSQTSWRCWDVSHSVQGIRMGALESKARRAFQVMQAEYWVNFDSRF